MTVLAKMATGSTGSGSAAVELMSDADDDSNGEALERPLNDSIYQTQSQMNFCKACWCNKKDSIDCRKPNELKSIPILRDKNFREQITEIIIENQSAFKSLDRGSLKFYPNVEKL